MFSDFICTEMINEILRRKRFLRDNNTIQRMSEYVFKAVKVGVRAPKIAPSERSND